MWRIISRMFGRKDQPPRDPAVAAAASASHAETETARDLIDKIRDSAERRRLANATRIYEERLHGNRGH
jgi:hypothetical protein